MTCTGVREGKLVDPVVRCIREKPIDEIDTIEQFEELEEVWGICSSNGDEKSMVERELYRFSVMDKK